MSGRVRRASCAVGVGVLVLCARTVSSGQQPDLAHLLETYRRGDAESAVRALASWSAPEIDRGDAHLDAGDSWNRLALGLLMLEAAREVSTNFRALNALARRGYDEIAGACLGPISDPRLASECHTGLQVVLASPGSYFEDIVGRIAGAFPLDPAEQVGVGTHFELWMPVVEASQIRGGTSKPPLDQETIGTSHGRVIARDASLAEAAYRRALSADPGYSEARVRLGRVLWTLDRPSEAEREWRAVIADRHASPSMIYLAGLFLGRLYESSGQFDVAETAYRSALDSLPRGQTVAAALGRLLLQSGREAEGWALMSAASESAAKAQQPDPWVTYSYGSVWWSERRLFDSLRQAVRQ